jgi:hypothetical protein
MGRYSIHPFQNFDVVSDCCGAMHSLHTNSIVAKRPMTDGEDYNLAGIARTLALTLGRAASCVDYLRVLIIIRSTRTKSQIKTDSDRMVCGHPGCEQRKARPFAFEVAQINTAQCECATTPPRLLARGGVLRCVPL